MSDILAPDTSVEEQLQSLGYRAVASVDEVGRGSWAGPLVAAAVILPCSSLETRAALVDVRDSKVLSPEKRYALYLHIMFYARAVALGWIDHAEIDDIGLGEANRRAMLLAVSRLSPAADALIVDHVRLPELAIEQRRFPRAENVSLSVAAASIVAKVSRDRWMEAWDQAYPPYNFARNKGYGTAAHRAALAVHGPCRLHRRSFQPVASFA